MAYGQFRIILIKTKIGVSLYIDTMIAITEILFQPDISKYFIDNYNLQPDDVLELGQAPL